MREFDAVIIGAGQDGPVRADMPRVKARRRGRSSAPPSSAVGDEAIHGVLDMMHAGVTYDVLRHAVPIHPTVSELVPTMLGEMTP